MACSKEDLFSLHFGAILGGLLRPMAIYFLRHFGLNSGAKPALRAIHFQNYFCAIFTRLARPKGDLFSEPFWVNLGGGSGPDELIS